VRPVAFAGDLPLVQPLGHLRLIQLFQHSAAAKEHYVGRPVAIPIDHDAGLVEAAERRIEHAADEPLARHAGGVSEFLEVVGEEGRIGPGASAPGAGQSGEHLVPRCGAHGGSMSVAEDHSFASQAVEVWRRNRPAETAQAALAQIINEDQDNVWLLRRLRRVDSHGQQQGAKKNGGKYGGVTRLETKRVTAYGGVHRTLSKVFVQLDSRGGKGLFCLSSSRRLKGSAICDRQAV
jgi:hypothetical protein